MSVVGLDFGAQNAVIAAAGRGGVDVILNGNSNRLNPAMVGFGESRLMGEGASSKATSNFRKTVMNMKRLVGLAFDDPRAQAEMKRCFFQCSPIKHEGGPDTIGVKVNDDQVVSIEAVAGMLVKHMGSIAAEKSAASSTLDNSNMDTTLSDPANPLFPQDWVISVPGYYTDAQKRALLSGCQIAGINGVQRLIHDTTATALAYGIFKDIKKEFTKDSPTQVMFIDMGATAYSVSIVSFEPGKLIVKSTQHDADLGGREFDSVIAEWIAEAFETKYKGKLSGKPMERPKTAIKILAAAEKAKKTLSPTGVKEARINLECLMDDLDFSCALKASEYAEMCEPLIARLAPPIERALAEAKIQASDLNSVEIVGGATRVGSVKKVLAEILGLDVTATNCGLSTTMNADEAVCRGAALQSAILSPRFKVLPYEIIEYQPYPVKISWEGDIQDGMEVDGDADGSSVPTNSVIMFERGSNFPSVRRVTLRRSGEFTVKATYDDSAALVGLDEASSKDIATFTIKAPAEGENKIRVNVKQDVHGTTTLSSAQMVEEYEEEVPVPAAEAKEGEEGKKEEPKTEKKKKMKKTNLQFSIQRPIEFTKAEIDAAYEVEVAMSNADRLVRETSDMRNALESYIYDMRDKITLDSQLAPYCSEDEKAKFSAALESDENWLYEDGFDATKAVYAEKLRELNKIGNPIVARQYEAGARPNAVAILQRNAEKYKNWLNTTANDEKFAHITDEEKSTAHAKCDEVTGWMYDMLDKQGSLSLSDDPVVTVNDIHAKSKELSDVVSPIMNKPVPKPKKTEEKKAEEAPPAEEKADDAKPSDAPEPMETD